MSETTSPHLQGEIKHPTKFSSPFQPALETDGSSPLCLSVFTYTVTEYGILILETFRNIMTVASYNTKTQFAMGIDQPTEITNNRPWLLQLKTFFSVRSRIIHVDNCAGQGEGVW